MSASLTWCTAFIANDFNSSVSPRGRARDKRSPLARAAYYTPTNHRDLKERCQNAMSCYTNHFRSVLPPHPSPGPSWTIVQKTGLWLSFFFLPSDFKTFSPRRPAHPSLDFLVHPQFFGPQRQLATMRALQKHLLGSRCDAGPSFYLPISAAGISKSLHVRTCGDLPLPITTWWGLWDVRWVTKAQEATVPTLTELSKVKKWELTWPSW